MLTGESGFEHLIKKVALNSYLKKWLGIPDPKSSS